MWIQIWLHHGQRECISFLGMIFLSHSVWCSRSHEHKVSAHSNVHCLSCSDQTPTHPVKQPWTPQMDVWWYPVEPAKWGKTQQARGLWILSTNFETGGAHSWALPFPPSLTSRLTAVSKGNFGLKSKDHMGVSDMINRYISVKRR